MKKTKIMSKISRRGKIGLTVLVAVMFIGVASAAYLTNYGNITATVDVEQSIRLDGMVYGDGSGLTVDDSIGTLVAGCEWGKCHDLHLHSQASNPVSTKVSSVVSPDDGGLTTMIAAEVQGAGVDCSDYTVPSGTEIEATELVAKASDTITETLIVNDGTVSPTVISSDGDTIVAKNYLGVTLDDGIQITANGATVKGFVIKPTVLLGETWCVYLGTTSGATLSNVVISCNEIDGLSTATSSGMVLVTGETYNNILIENNKIHDLTTGIYINPHTGTINIEHNYFKDCAAGIGGASGANVRYNVFDWDGEAIGLDDVVSPRSLVLRYNNFLGDAAVKNYGTNGQYALNNWWDCDGIDISGDVNAGWNTWLHDDVITLDPNETVYFMIQYCTPDNAVGSYTSTVTFLPHSL